MRPGDPSTTMESAGRVSGAVGRGHRARWQMQNKSRFPAQAKTHKGHPSPAPPESRPSVTRHARDIRVQTRSSSLRSQFVACSFASRVTACPSLRSRFTVDCRSLLRTMPREIVTVQLGQCGNQSADSTHSIPPSNLTRLKWVPCTGSGYAPSTALTRKAF